MGFFTPDPACDCCQACEAFECSDGGFPFPGTDTRIVNSITFSIANTLTTNLHMFFGDNVVPESGDPPGGHPASYTYPYKWIQLTDLTAIVGNYVVPRLVESQCFSNEVVFTGIPVDGFTIWGATAVDGSNCPTGTITSWTGSYVGGSPTWEITATFDNLLGLTLQANMRFPPNESGGYQGLTNGLTIGDDTTPNDADLVVSDPVGLVWTIPRSSILCDGGNLALNVAALTPVGGSFPPCSGYPTNSGLTASYTLDT